MLWKVIKVIAIKIYNRGCDILQFKYTLNAVYTT